METKEEQETWRREAREHQLKDNTEIETEIDSDSLCDLVDEKDIGDISQIVNLLSNSFRTDKRGKLLLC